MPHPFRFGVTAMPVPGQGPWPDVARAVEAAGFHRLFLPENHPLPDGMTSAGVALGATVTLEVGTFVLASPLHDPRHVAWQAHSLATTSGGRFRFGIGTGRPDVAADAEALGVPFGTGSERLARVAATLDALDAADGSGPHTPVLVAAGGPKALRLAADRADTIALAISPGATPDEAEAITSALPDRVEIASSIFAIGDDVPPFARHFLGPHADGLAERDSLAWLPGDPDDLCAKLIERRDRFGISCFTVSSELMDAMTPAVQRLRDR